LHAATVGESTVIQIAMANHFVLPPWFQELSEPVTQWFQTHLAR
jgi:hypothetical protein